MIIEHGLDMFCDPGDEFIFICNDQHLEATEMRRVLENLRPGCTILSIPQHKLGPVHTLLPALPFLQDTEEVLVSYRSEEHTSELPSLMRISYAVFCLQKKIYLLHTNPKL